MFYVDRAIKQFWKHLTSITAVKGGRVKCHVQMFNIAKIETGLNNFHANSKA